MTNTDTRQAVLLSSHVKTQTNVKTGAQLLAIANANTQANNQYGYIKGQNESINGREGSALLNQIQQMVV